MSWEGVAANCLDYHGMFPKSSWLGQQQAMAIALANALIVMAIALAATTEATTTAEMEAADKLKAEEDRKKANAEKMKEWKHPR